MNSNTTNELPSTSTAAPGARQASLADNYDTQDTDDTGDTQDTQDPQDPHEDPQDTPDAQSTKASQDTQPRELDELWNLPRIVKFRELEQLKKNVRDKPSQRNLNFRNDARIGLTLPGSFMTMDFVTLGMLILDDITYTDPENQRVRKLTSIIGGAGAYAAFGARNVPFPDRIKYVGWIVHAGSDFPPKVRKEIESWGVGTRWIETPERVTTRAKNVYTDWKRRDFSFITDQIQIDPDMLDTTQLMSKTYHLIGSPQRCIDLVKGIMAARRKILQANADSVTHCVLMRPIFVWEPMESSCRPDQLQAFYEAMKYVDVFSPNEAEFADLMGLSADSELSFDLLKVNCNKLLTLGFGPKPSAVVVRLGARGCHVGEYARHFQLDSYHSMIHKAHEFPFQFVNDEPFQLMADRAVVDVTGGGSAFLGGFCRGLLVGCKAPPFTAFEIGASWGTVAAGLAVEQAGMPILTYDEEGDELWNGEPYVHRLMAYSMMVKPPPSLPDSVLEQASPFKVEKVLGNGNLLLVRKVMACMRG